MSSKQTHAKVISQKTLDGTPAERLSRHLHSKRSDLIDSGIYIGDSTNQFRQDVEWKRHGHGDHLVFKESTHSDTQAETISISNDLPLNRADDSETVSVQEWTPATLSVVVLASYDDCWLTPCGNWRGPTQVTKKFEDLKLSFLGE